MEKRVLVIDLSSQVRDQLISQLGSIGSFQFLPVKDLAEGSQILGTLKNFQGLVFVSLSPGISEKLESFREQNRQACLIPILDQVSFENLRPLVALGVDQILLRPVQSEVLVKKVSSAERFRSLFLNEDITYSSIRKFEIVVDELAPQFFRIALKGPMTEAYHLPEIKAPANSTLFFDCEFLTVINSVGIKDWIKWMKTLSENGFSRFEFENFGPGFLQLSSFVQGFLPVTASVNSFYLHYWSEEQDLTKNFRFSLGKDFDSQKMTIPGRIQVTEDGKASVYQVDDSVRLILKYYQGQLQIT